MNFNDFKNIVDQHPDLTTHGFGVDSGFNSNFQTERNALYYCFDEFLVCCDWWALVLKRKGINTRPGQSYHLKHKAENWAETHGYKTTYFHEGAFIAAAIYNGFNYRPSNKSTSAWFNISSNTKIDGKWL
jgi:hypothetical protein